MKTSLDFLIFLAKQGAVAGFIRLPTTELASKLGGASQQTVSRWLASCAKQGYVERRGSEVRILPAGKRKLEEAYAALKKALDAQQVHEYAFAGTVASGFREGGYYISLPQYQKQFQEKLGFAPYPGTLNVKLAGSKAVGQSRLVRAFAGISISGFDKDGREFGAARCYRCVISGKIGGALIVPLRTHYGEDIAEIIAPVYLREKLRLKDGSAVRIKVFPK
jgi:riboflavin kinase